MVSSHRGDEFRTAFAHLGELRSIIPATVNVLALTATATNTTLLAVKKRLSMTTPILVGMPPYRNNIRFTIQLLPSMKCFCESILEEVKNKGCNYPKTIIFCQKYDHCSELYHNLKQILGPYFTLPYNYPDLHEFR